MSDRSFLGKTSLTDLDAAKAWLEALVDNDMDFHLEDSPETIIEGKTGERLFSDEEAVIVRRQVDYMYGMDWGEYQCPIGYMLAVLEWKGRL